jgi:hypothetical protein
LRAVRQQPVVAILHGGFMLGRVVSMPGNLATIADLLVLELQRCGRFRRRYKGATLREICLMTIRSWFATRGDDTGDDVGWIYNPDHERAA